MSGGPPGQAQNGQSNPMSGGMQPMGQPMGQNSLIPQGNGPAPTMNPAAMQNYQNFQAMQQAPFQQVQQYGQVLQNSAPQMQPFQSGVAPQSFQSQIASGLGAPHTPYQPVGASATPGPKGPPSATNSGSSNAGAYSMPFTRPPAPVNRGLGQIMNNSGINQR